MSDSADSLQAPTLDQIRQARESLGNRIKVTPSWRWQSSFVDRKLGAATSLFLKLELFQHAGSFKVRGALRNIMARLQDAKEQGVVTVSAGNHAMATAHASRALGVHAKLVMPRTASPVRIEACRQDGAELILANDVHELFGIADEIQAKEGRVFVHPFDGWETALGTATLGLELCQQVEDLDAVVVPIGGGGLCSGVAAAVKQVSPHTQVFGVEPEGADSMHRSFEANAPVKLDQIQTIADSLGAPHAAAYTFGLCRRFVDGLCKVSDAQIVDAMAWLFQDAKLAVEPAGAAATAALFGPLRDELRGKRVALIVCGANIDVSRFHELVSRARIEGSAPEVG